MLAVERKRIGPLAKETALHAFGQRLKRLRRRVSLTQAAVAQQLGKADQTVRNWERGRSEPSNGDKEQLAGLYGVSVDELYEDGDMVDEIDKLSNRIRELPATYQATILERVMRDLVDGMSENGLLPRAREETREELRGEEG